MFATRNKCIATSNKCLTSSNKKLFGTIIRIYWQQMHIIYLHRSKAVKMMESLVLSLSVNGQFKQHH